MRLPTDLGRERVVTVLNALGDDTRMRIVERVLREGEVSCSSLDETLGLAKSTISYHAKILHAAGLIVVRRDGRFFHYGPTAGLKEIEPILDTLRSMDLR